MTLELAAAVLTLVAGIASGWMWRIAYEQKRYVKIEDYEVMTKLVYRANGTKSWDELADEFDELRKRSRE